MRSNFNPWHQVVPTTDKDDVVKGIIEIPKGNTLSWHFIAPNVHDFTWAADPNYTHNKMITKSGIELHFLYK